MEIVLLIIIGLIAKNFKSILEFLNELGQQYGPPPIVSNPGGHPNLSKKAPKDFKYEDDYYSEEEDYESKPKAYKVKNSQTELNSEFSDNLEKIQTNSKENSKFREDPDENLIQLDDLKKGVIWQEILEPPRARRPYRKII